jgi:hypothetical protein
MRQATSWHFPFTVDYRCRAQADTLLQRVTRLRDEDETMPLDVIEILRELISRPSVNPMGREVDGDHYYEHRVTDYLQQLFDQLGLPWQRQTVAAGRDNSARACLSSSRVTSMIRQP